MDITIRVPDDVAAQYRIYAGEGGKPEDAIVAQLTRFAACPPAMPYVLIPPGAKRELEAAMNSLPITSGEDLLAKVRALASLQIGEVRLNFTAAQLAELKGKAERWGKSVPEFVDSVVRRILEEQILATAPRPGEMLEAGKVPVAEGTGVKKVMAPGPVPVAKK
jgi:hypothetical protein